MELTIMTGKQCGFGYVLVLIWVALTAAGVGAVTEIWSSAQRRDNEAELLFIGAQFQSALSRYSASGRFPKQLDDLLGDETSILKKRYLRKVYTDPMTGKANWGVISLPDGQIIGVHSLSDKEPLKKKGFSSSQEGLTDKKKYSEWLFLAPTTAKSKIQ
jgi:hypothetical protein